MAHTFDTELARPQRTLIVQGAVGLLAGLKRPTGYLRAVIEWGGVIRSYADDEGIDELWQALQGSAPGVAVVLGDRTSRPAGMGGFKSQSELELLIYFLNANPRSLAVGRQSSDAGALAVDTADPGLHVMFEHVEELLVGQRCGNTATIKQIHLTREQEVRTRNGYSLWLQSYALTLDRQINEYRTVTQMLTDLRTTIRVSDSGLTDPNDPKIVIDNPIP